jgi:hypothetical protein
MKNILLLFVLLNSYFGFAQETTEQKSAFAQYLNTLDYRIAIQNVGIGMPPNFVNGKAHPGLAVGVQNKFADSSRWDYHFDLGYFAIHSLQRVAYLKPGIGYPISIAQRVELRPNVSLGILGVGQINDEFKFVNGGYEKVSRHRLQLMPSFGLESFMQIANSKKISYEVMLGYEFGVQLPFSSLSNILPLNQLKIGVRIKK